MIQPTLRGSLAGVAGTAVMTMMMRVVGPKVIPQDMRPDEFVPKKVVEWAERRAGHPDALSEQAELKASYPLHFTYGTSMGSLYGTLRDRLPGPPAPLAGALFGVGVWALSFEQLLPRLGVMPATTEQPKRKWPMPVMAHVVFGVTTALAYDALKRTGKG